MHSDPVIRQYLEILERPEWMFWLNHKAAFQALGDLGAQADDIVVNGLTRLICAPSTRTKRRMHAAVALLRIGPPAASAVPQMRRSLIGLLAKNELGEQAHVLVSTLSEIGGVKALGELLCESSCPWEAKLYVADHLSNIDALPALQSLITFLETVGHESGDWTLKNLTYSRVVRAIGCAMGLQLDDRFTHNFWMPLCGALGDVAEEAVKALVGIIKNPSHLHPQSNLPLEILVLLNAMYPSYRPQSADESPVGMTSDFVRWWLSRNISSRQST